jgi:hypothetical protein
MIGTVAARAALFYGMAQRRQDGKTGMTLSSFIWARTPGWSVALAGLLAGVLAAGAAVAAKPPAPGQAPAVQTVLDCQKIADASQRLACFDAAAAGVANAESTGDLVTVDRQQRRAARQKAFGFALPSLTFLNRGDRPEELDRITATVAAASRNPQTGKWTVKLDDGALWRQTDNNDILHPPHPGSSVEIRKAALGSFTMKVEGQFAVRVHRDN